MSGVYTLSALYRYALANQRGYLATHPFSYRCACALKLLLSHRKTLLVVTVPLMQKRSLHVHPKRSTMSIPTAARAHAGPYIDTLSRVNFR